MSTASGPPPRVRVTSNRGSASRVRHRPITQELDEQTGLGDVYLAGLMRAQLRLALIVIALLVVGIGGFPLLLALVPATRTITVFGIPFPWFVLGALVYPAAWVLAWWYARQAERIETEFSDIVGSS